MSIRDIESGKEFVEIDARNTGERPFSVWFFDGDRRFNIPKSVMEDWPDVGDDGTIMVERWFAEQEGLI